MTLWRASVCGLLPPTTPSGWEALIYPIGPTTRSAQNHLELYRWQALLPPDSWKNPTYVDLLSILKDLLQHRRHTFVSQVVRL